MASVRDFLLAKYGDANTLLQSRIDRRLGRQMLAFCSDSTQATAALPARLIRRRSREGTQFLIVSWSLNVAAGMTADVRSWVEKIPDARPKVNRSWRRELSSRDFTRRDALPFVMDVQKPSLRSRIKTESYSARSATTGSTRAARRAGSQAA